MWRPPRMSSEQAIDYADLKGKKKPKAKTQQARSHRNPAVPTRELSCSEGKGDGNDSGDQHHSRDGAYSKEKEVSNGPPGITDRGHDQKGHC